MGVITHYEIHPYANFLPEMTEREFSDLKEDISGIGQLEPITLFEGKILDGRHRYKACVELGIEPIVSERNLENLSPIDVIRALNIHRRHLTAGQIGMVVQSFLEHAEQRAKERQREAGGDKKSEQARSVRANLPEAIEHKKATDEVAEQFGVSGRTVRDAKVVAKKGTHDERKAAINGKRSVSSIAKEIRTRSKSVFNKSDIEWTDYTWNPVTGCHHNCSYCYARGIANRFTDIFPQGFNYHVRYERFDAPDNQPAPQIGKNKVFVCSMADLFGDWVDEEVIFKVLEKVSQHPEFMFIFLTKNPKRLTGYSFPENSWVGATVDSEKALGPTIKSLANVDVKIKYISFEPLTEEWDIDFAEVADIVDWVIIGCDSSNRQNKFIPSFDYIYSLFVGFRSAGLPVFLKPNITESFPQEFPA